MAFRGTLTSSDYQLYLTTVAGVGMSINVMARKLLWGRAGNRCSFPDCDMRLTLDLEDPTSSVLRDSGAVIGEEAHIRSGRAGGPRFDAGFDPAMIDGYSNLLLLCPTHHTIIDKDGGAAFSVEQLIKMRTRHESDVDAKQTTHDVQRREASERTLGGVLAWERKAGVDAWPSVALGLSHPIPRIDFDDRSLLLKQGEWLLGRWWPPGTPTVSRAFANLSHVLGVLTWAMEAVLESEESPAGTRFYEARRQYKRIGWNPPLYTELLNEHRRDCATLWWLIAELTRAYNFVVDAVRQDADPYYRFDEGYVMLYEGDDLHARVSSPRYLPEEAAVLPHDYTLQQLVEAIRTEAAAHHNNDAEGIDLNVFRPPFTSTQA
ncbi:hypothetical protein [Pseudokineococcus sp. 1T1Z-3]|uniref:hypothetical protein n=1 Tax=Pseudokineococcus sp. 1T1Z-3 TaxID=3132745 RepID=UPI0030ADB7ED